MENLINYINTHRICKVSYIRQHHLTDEVKETLSRYNLTLDELVYRFKHNIALDKIFTCSHCGKMVRFGGNNGYPNSCSKKCSLAFINRSEEHKNKVKATCREKYGTDNYTQTQEYKDKAKATCLEKYGVDSHNKVQKCKDKARKTCVNKYGVSWYASTQHCKDKIKQTCLDKYGVDNYTQSEEYNTRLNEIQEKRNNTIFEKYNTYYTNTEEYKTKRINTMKQNGTCILSKFEEECYKLLIDKFGSEDILRQYRSTLYPFNCDFYIKSLDLYIECNGNWTHGKYHNKCLGSFNKDSKEHLEILEEWKVKAVKSDYFKNAIYTWTNLDVKKLECFKKNNLNYKIFWNLEEVKDWLGVL